MAKVLRNRARFKIQRRLGIELPGLGKPGALERRPYAPGQHGMKRRKLSDYTIRLTEKQKLIFHYGVLEKQLINYVKKAKKRRDRAWVDTLVEMLERRIDNVIFRLNFAPSIPAARQMVVHGHVLVNGKKVKVPNFQIKPEDTITLSDKGYQSQNYLRSLETPRFSAYPSCYEVQEKAENKREGKVLALPLPSDIPFDFEARLVTEYYWRVKS